MVDVQKEDNKKELSDKPKFEDFQAVERDPASKFHYTFILFNGNNSDFVGKIVKPRGYTRIPVQQAESSLAGINFMWSPLPFSARIYREIDKANLTRTPPIHLVHNHIENIKGISTKTGLYSSLKRYYKTHPAARAFQYTVCHSTPISYIVMSHYEDTEFTSFLNHFKDIEHGIYDKQRMPGKHCKENVWLIKPASLNQGRGIEVFRNNVAEMSKFLKSKAPFTHWVIQKYVEHPLLYHGRKFDLRMWALITQSKSFYYYQKGYMRTSSHEYSLSSPLNYVHLTNNCLQQHGDKYGAFEEGNTLGLEVLEEFLKERSEVNFERDIICRMKDLMIDTFLCVKTELNPSKRRNCFELLGFDFLIDEDMRVWLIEVNTNPYLGIPNKYIESLLPKMLNDLFEIVLDPFIPPLNKLPERSVCNQFELLYDDRKKVNKRRNFATPFYPRVPRVEVGESYFPHKEDSKDTLRKSTEYTTPQIKKTKTPYDWSVHIESSLNRIYTGVKLDYILKYPVKAIPIKPAITVDREFIQRPHYSMLMPSKKTEVRAKSRIRKHLPFYY